MKSPLGISGRAVHEGGESRQRPSCGVVPGMFENSTRPVKEEEAIEDEVTE